MKEDLTPNLRWRTPAPRMAKQSENIQNIMNIEPKMQMGRGGGTVSFLTQTEVKTGAAANILGGGGSEKTGGGGRRGAGDTALKQNSRARSIRLTVGKTGRASSASAVAS